MTFLMLTCHFRHTHLDMQGKRLPLCRAYALSIVMSAMSYVRHGVLRVAVRRGTCRLDKTAAASAMRKLTSLVTLHVLCLA